MPFSCTAAYWNWRLEVSLLVSSSSSTELWGLMCFFAHAVACSSGNDEAVAELDSIVERGLSACCC